MGEEGEGEGVLVGSRTLVVEGPLVEVVRGEVAPVGLALDVAALVAVDNGTVEVGTTDVGDDVEVKAAAEDDVSGGVGADVDAATVEVIVEGMVEVEETRLEKEAVVIDCTALEVEAIVLVLEDLSKEDVDGELVGAEGEGVVVEDTTLVVTAALEVTGEEVEDGGVVRVEEEGV